MKNEMQWRVLIGLVGFLAGAASYWAWQRKLPVLTEAIDELKKRVE